MTNTNAPQTPEQPEAFDAEEASWEACMATEVAHLTAHPEDAPKGWGC